MYFVRAVADRSTSLYYCDARVLLLMEAKSVMSAPVMSAPITELIKKSVKCFGNGVLLPMETKSDLPLL